MTSIEQLWAGWRFAGGPAVASDGRPHVAPDREEGRSMFESILASGRPDDETYILWRGTTVFAILNVFPYNPGHLMVLPNEAAASIELLPDEVHRELWDAVRQAVVAVKSAFRPDGVNVGVNDGTAGGGSIPDHLHVHVVPRWRADTNFMTTTANARVLPLPLHDTWERLRDAWPEPASDPGPGGGPAGAEE